MLINYRYCDHHGWSAPAAYEVPPQRTNETSRDYWTRVVHELERQGAIPQGATVVVK